MLLSESAPQGRCRARKNGTEGSMSKACSPFLRTRTQAYVGSNWARKDAGARQR
ncbi:hypothetical protein GGTG_07134 [Gaeumannomyces tritici R3-111a-1]|uniref:Uncharacterized protein n=1 Tax=Gaeumannomyces tritici (strain R3-111a-1) TaxID=644352 RepID=J3P0T9_GAET3|nr:hypothetical protein GGTG_07134 [Gaeumannomyces tritici R3-111a-1]EJT77222.1 hypothetical protein GGTG_07134 [Gaeumannomyces tritici R3-111a-1]